MDEASIRREIEAAVAPIRASYGNRLDEQSVETLVRRLVALDLRPDLGQVAIVPRKQDDKVIVQGIITIQGSRALLARIPNVKSATAVIVHAKDKFEVEGDVVRHTYNPFDPERNLYDFDKILGAYVVATLTDGSKYYHFVSKDKIARCRACASERNRQTVWTKWLAEMVMKTAIHDFLRRGPIPFDNRVNEMVREALAMDDEALETNPDRVVVDADNGDISSDDLPPVIDDVPEEPADDNPFAKARSSAEAMQIFSANAEKWKSDSDLYSKRRKQLQETLAKFKRAK